MVSPTEKISDTRKITLVMQQGAVIDRDRLKLDLHRDPDYQPVGFSMAGHRRFGYAQEAGETLRETPQVPGGI